MKPLFAVLLLSTSAFAADSPAVIKVKVTAGLVDLRAVEAPVSAVLDQLARETGMTVVYDGPRPTTAVTMNLHGLTSTQAVAKVLEGLDLRYGIQVEGKAPPKVVVITAKAERSPSESTAPTAADSLVGEPEFETEPTPGSLTEAIEAMSESGTAESAVSGMSEEGADPGMTPAGAQNQSLSDPPRPGRTGTAPVADHPPLPPRPADLPTSPFVPYAGPLNPKAAEAAAQASPNAPPAPVPGEVVEMDGMDPNGTPTRQLKEKVPTQPPN